MVFEVGRKKNIYFVQANAVYGDSVKSVYLPYATGCIAAYAFSDEFISSQYSFGGYVYTRMDINKALDFLKDPYMVAFSCTTWNTEYSKVLSKAVRERYPDCKILFGGHNVPPDDTMLKQNSEVDFLIHGEGEIPFRQILEALSREGELCDICNISYRHNGETITTKTLHYDFIDFPSPYTEGFFDSIINDGYDFSVILETNRGCPNRCAFCDWGALKSKVRLFHWEKVCAELLWIAEKGIDYIYCADANFGLFDRDVEVVNEMLKLKEKYGHPQKFKVNFSKNRIEVVNRISSMMSRNNMGKAQTLSFQSLDPEVLKNVGRKNLDIKYFKQLISFYNEEDIQTYSELILPLPGETKESFKNGVNELLLNGQHKSLNVYPCELLPNSIMGSKEYKEKFGLSSIRVPFVQYHCREDSDESGVTEYSDIVVKTADMTAADFADSYLFAVTVQAMHILGITRFVSVYLCNEKGIDYKEFYTSLIEYAQSTDGYMKKIFDKTYKKIVAVSRGESPLAECDERFGNITYEPDEILYLRTLYGIDVFFDELSDFIGRFDIEENLCRSLLKFQKDMIRHPQRPLDTIESDYGFYKYFCDFFSGENSELLCENEEILLTGADEKSWEDFARFVLWYGRRNGETLYLSTAYAPKEGLSQ